MNMNIFSRIKSEYSLKMVLVLKKSQKIEVYINSHTIYN